MHISPLICPHTPKALPPLLNPLVLPQHENPHYHQPGGRECRKSWRRGSESNRRMMVLQTIPLGHLGTAPLFKFYTEKLSPALGIRLGIIVCKTIPFGQLGYRAL
jgi:hypothetical protein